MANGIVNRNYYGAIEGGRVDADQATRRKQVNALGQLDVQEAQRFNALAQDPSATPEQFARIGRSDIANSVLNARAAAGAPELEKQKRLFTAAQYALQSQSPKEFLRQNFPDIAAMNPTFEQENDDQIRQQLMGLMARAGTQAGIAPQQRGQGALYKYVDSQTGEVRYGTVDEARGETPYQYQAPTAGSRPPAPPRGYRYAQGGDLEPIPGGPADPSRGAQDVKPPTEGERTAANYYGRMQAAESILGTNFKPSTAEYMAAKKVMSGGSISASLANAYLSEDAQSYYQAAADWVRAKLRKESGAVIATEEMETEIKTYFPMPGDSPRVIEQKRLARLQAQEGMANMGGRATKDYSKKAPTESQATQPVLTLEQIRAKYQNGR
jgi:hypothetical protein